MVGGEMERRLVRPPRQVERADLDPGQRVWNRVTYQPSLDECVAHVEMPTPIGALDRAPIRPWSCKMQALDPLFPPTVQFGLILLTGHLGGLWPWTRWIRAVYARGGPWPSFGCHPLGLRCSGSSLAYDLAAYGLTPRVIWINCRAPDRNMKNDKQSQ